MTPLTDLADDAEELLRTIWGSGWNVANFRMSKGDDFVLGHSPNEALMKCRKNHPHSWTLYWAEHWVGDVRYGRWEKS